jgi:hypothetical protein
MCMNICHARGKFRLFQVERSQTRVKDFNRQDIRAGSRLTSFIEIKVYRIQAKK